MHPSCKNRPRSGEFPRPPQWARGPGPDRPFRAVWCLASAIPLVEPGCTFSRSRNYCMKSHYFEYRQGCGCVRCKALDRATALARRALAELNQPAGDEADAKREGLRGDRLTDLQHQLPPVVGEGRAE